MRQEKQEMVTGWARTRTMVLAIALAGTGLAALPQVASAQDAEARLRKIESEIKALQRQVFPGGDGRFFTPEVITPTPGSSTGATGAASTSAVTDILGRLDSLESQLARLTAQTEENTNAVSQLALRVEDIEKARAAEQAPALPADPLLGGGTVPAPAGGAQFATVPSTAGITPAPQPATRPATPTPAPKPTPAATPAPAASGPSAARIAAVQAIAKPTTGDAADDEYSYGFRLWDAKFYPEAQQQLGLFVEKYPKHWRMTYARNLLGRAYMDDGKPRDAAQWFLQNYQQDKAGERAPDSLLYLAEAMIAIKDTNRACLALAEFSEAYPAIATGRLQMQYQANVAKVKCTKG
ncbi:hypothetical protein [Altererythrobacter fulvus]|uniref:tetratricopeptide repeat protein n=1 Tax=Caenibius fulvus TaxID=2126012 RepID=UPI003016E540